MNDDGLPLLIGLLMVPAIWTFMRPAERVLIVRVVWRVWPVLRPVIGWLCLALGVLGIILPILQGIVFLMIGAALIGPRHPVIRKTRIGYKRLLRRMVRSPRPVVRWLGRRGQDALFLLHRKIRSLRTRHHLRVQARRRFRLAVVPDRRVCTALNRWRTRFDPGLQQHLPPHIVLLAAARSAQRPLIERAIDTICADTPSFSITLDAVLRCDSDQRVVCTLGEGRAALDQLRQAIAGEAGRPLRFSERPIWPSLTLAKLRRQRSLQSAYAEISAHFEPQTWQVTELTLLEERWGYTWHPVRHFRLSTPVIRSNDASSLIAEEVH